MTQTIQTLPPACSECADSEPCDLCLRDWLAHLDDLDEDLEPPPDTLANLGLQV